MARQFDDDLLQLEILLRLASAEAAGGLTDAAATLLGAWHSLQGEGGIMLTIANRRLYDAVLSGHQSPQPVPASRSWTLPSAVRYALGESDLDPTAAP